MAENTGALEGANNTRALRDYDIPTINGTTSSIRHLTIQANNFEIKPTIIQMIQTSI